ncbi:hypothetical protein [Methanogenium organophilum]|uniref:Uncharacterized protein n=1 Tax=Methanogenium organophilum TaxID=2199 RepID=A0A9X9S494_METOG|nr:hypothetical protein [Methanogenium organophilum]WAI01503.1 hypothetical protein OU421_01125 [Methanogenium organophilum]
MSRIGVVTGLLIILAVIIVSAGCLSYSIGTVLYDGDAVHVNVDNKGEARDAAMQITVFDLSGFKQVEVDKIVHSVHLSPGTNDVTFDVALEPGSYRLFIYMMQDGERLGCVIEDLEV